MTRIVVIEDNVQNARMANKLLTRAGYEVLLAEDGESGLTTVFENQPDLILIDLGLPDIDGQTVIGLVRQQEHLKEIPIIAFTAWPPEEAHDMASRYGCDGVITKPINTRTFAEQLGAFVSAKNASDEADTASDNTNLAEATISDSVSIPDTDMITGSDRDAIESKSDNPADSPQVKPGD